MIEAEVAVEGRKNSWEFSCLMLPWVFLTGNEVSSFAKREEGENEVWFWKTGNIIDKNVFRKSKDKQALKFID